MKRLALDAPSTVGGPSHYDVLEVSEAATMEELRQAYRRLARQHHEDTRGAYDAGFISSLNSAYVTLTNPQSRARYDTRRRLPAVATSERIRRLNTPQTLALTAMAVMALTIGGWLLGVWLSRVEAAGGVGRSFGSPQRAAAADNGVGAAAMTPPADPPAAPPTAPQVAVAATAASVSPAAALLPATPPQPVAPDAPLRLVLSAELTPASSGTLAGSGTAARRAPTP